MLESIESVNIEMPVLGCMILFGERFSEYIPKLHENDFVYYLDVFKIIKAEYESGNKTDKTLLAAKMFEAGLSEKALQCSDSVTTAENFKAYFDELKRISSQRRLRDKLYGLAISYGDITIAELQKIVEDESNISTGGFETKAEENIKKYIANIGVKKQRIYTGFRYLDNTLGGLRLPSVCYIGARPSTGKTTFAINIAANQEGKKILMISLEMSAEMIYERMASAALLIDYTLFSRQKTTAKQNQQIKAYAEELKNSNTFFVIDDVYGIESISAAVAEIKPELVIIDYIQKVTSTRVKLTMREQMEYVSGELKRIAKNGKCCVIALSQISRQGKDAPTMSDLKESGALEADGDYIMLMHRPYVLDKTGNKDPGATEILIDKNKFGNAGKLDMYFDGAHQQFKEIDTQHDDKRPAKPHYEPPVQQSKMTVNYDNNDEAPPF